MKYLFVCVHPDDLEFNCGNIIADLSKRGAETHILSLTQGEFGIFEDRWKGRKLAKIRVNELIRAATINGVPKERVHFGNIPDGFVRFSEEHLKYVIEILNGIQPDIVFACEPYFTIYWHTDHINCGRLLYYIVTNQNNEKLPTPIEHPIKALYLYTSLKPDFVWPFSDPTNAYKALYQHKSQWWVLKWNKIFYPIEKRCGWSWKRKIGKWKYIEKFRRVLPDKPLPKEDLKSKLLIRLIYRFKIINPSESHYKVLKDTDPQYYEYIESLRAKYGFK